MLFINCVSEFNEEQKVLKEAETQKAAENAGPKGTYRFLKKAYILSSSTRLFLMSETVTRFFFSSAKKIISSIFGHTMRKCC